MQLSEKINQAGALYVIGGAATAFAADNIDEFREWLSKNEGMEELLAKFTQEEMQEDLKSAVINFAHLVSHVDELRDMVDILREVL